MKKLVFGLLMSSAAIYFAEGYPKEYSADASTPEKRAALTEELWKHDAANDVLLWPDARLKPEAKDKPFVFRENELWQRNLIVSEMLRPQFTFFRASGEGVKPMVVVYPGGGYYNLGWNKEGTEIAQWLNSVGFSAAVLLYRTNDRTAALADAQRTMGILRRDASKYGIDPNRIGVIGFSAGANLAVKLATNWRTRVYERVDDADDLSCRPDFMLPIYPWDLRPRNNPQSVGQGWKATHEIAEAYPIDRETPRAFIVQSLDDFCQIETAVGLDLALKKVGVDSTLKVYQNGGHGYGRRRLGFATDTWSYEAVGWLAQFLK